MGRALIVSAGASSNEYISARLTELGYYTGTVTGTYRGGTQAAVKAYQIARGLGSDGVAGRKTLTYMYDEARNEPTATPAPTQTPTVTPAPTGTPTAVPTQTPPPTSLNQTAAPVGSEQPQG